MKPFIWIEDDAWDDMDECYIPIQAMVSVVPVEDSRWERRCHGCCFQRNDVMCNYMSDYNGCEEQQGNTYIPVIFLELIKMVD